MLKNLKQIEPNIWEFTKDKVDFVFRFWEKEICALNPREDHNASLKFGDMWRWDLIIGEEILKDKKIFSFYLENFADSQIIWLKKRDKDA